MADEERKEHNYFQRLMLAAFNIRDEATNITTPMGVNRSVDGFGNDDEDIPDEDLLRTYDEMRRKDAQIKAVIRNVRLPILSAKYQIVSEDDDVREFVERQVGLSEGPANNINFMKMLRNQLSYMDFGFFVGEMMFGMVNGRREYLGMGLRRQTSIKNMKMDDTGRVVQVTQETQRGDVEITENIYHIAFDAEGNEPKGQPLLEACVDDWRHKQLLKTYQRLGLQRYAVGVPVIYHAPTMPQQVRRSYRKLLEDYIGGKIASMLLPEGQARLEIAGISDTRQIDNTNIIKYHDEQIAKAYLSQLIELGTSATGSRAVGDSFLTNFFNAKKAIAEDIVDNINEQIICPLVDFNFTNAEARLIVTDVLPEDMSDTLEWIERYVNANIVTLTDEQREYVVNDLLQLPGDDTGEGTGG